MKYLLRNKNYGTYLKCKNKTKRYLLYKEEATRFTKKKAEDMKNKFKHPENWDLIETKN